ncbi:tyrosine protein phosphatase [Bacillus sp. H-16]|uniref:tyrosine-protein phosphatase n=1 Tax=Alteribacter salitolerans TaxID=2912333 RepID=UPI0019649813|nr:CpsB/CapC family capsule biosynthesis tyrosine phosphatase [Alteribacter salitolerans]MBM7095670.1 tyrosine protein phosphatase [Alteribacter salitolerans]
MIDIHCHILPNLDDGPANKEEALELGKAAFEEGIHTILATPHHQHPHYHNDKNTILASIEELNLIFKDHQIDVKILPGQETRIYGELLEGFKNEEILTLNEGKYFFVEFPSSEIPRYSKRLLYDVQQQGLKPIIVHPERNQAVMKDPYRLYELVQGGCLTQLTAGSITGKFGKKIKRLSEDLIEANLAHFIASDAHDTIRRPFLLKDAYDGIEREFGIETRFYFQENAELLVEGNQVMVEPPQRVKTKKFLGLF